MSDALRDSPDTIYALSSGAPPAAIGVIRISGPRACVAAAALAGPLPEPRTAAFRRLKDPATGELLDECVLVWFPAGKSETGEDTVELQGHGSRAAIRATEEVLGRQPGLRLAEAGEFTRRAFLNGKTDLARIEGLADLIHAETAPQRRAAMAMMGGALSRKIHEFSQRLIDTSARIEAILNFSDEGDVDERAIRSDVSDRMASIAADLATELERPSAERLKDGIRTVIAGPPNAGKSTLLNALAGRDAAIVSPIAGTTRDVIEVPVALDGIPFLLADTAGLREPGADSIEAIGMARAQQMLDAADIVLWLGEADEAPAVTCDLIMVQAKADLNSALPSSTLSVSAMTGEGMAALVDALRAAAERLIPRPGDYALSARQRAAIARAHDALVEGQGLQDDVLIGESLRAARAALDEVTGRATTEAMLDELFSGFCIGK